LARRGGGLMDLLPLLPQALADGLLLGGVYAIVAVGLTMTFGQAQSHPTKAQ
jgi:branched-chain amino acid transport system permease protein